MEPHKGANPWRRPRAGAVPGEMPHSAGSLITGSPIASNGSAPYREIEVSFETIELNREDSLAILRFNRPDSYNALNDRMAAELAEAAFEVQEDPAIRALMITGNGTAFHAGGDIKMFVAAKDETQLMFHRTLTPLHAFISRLYRMPKPVVAAVNGPAAGAGFSIAMACDVVLAREDAVFTVGYSKIGLSPDGSMTYSLARLVGLRRAMELYLTNRVLTSAEAVEWGLATKVLPEENFMEDALEFARQLASGPTHAFGVAKDLFGHSLDHELETQMELEAKGILASTRTEDYREGTLAFVEKRPPNFKGK